MLQRVLRSRLTFTPRANGKGYEFSDPTRFDRLFTDVVVPAPTVPAFLKDSVGSSTSRRRTRSTPTTDVCWNAPRYERTEKGWRPWAAANPNAASPHLRGAVRVA